MTAGATGVPQGSLRWAVRDSLLRYVTVIAGGTYEVSDDVTVDEQGVFTFPLAGVQVEGDDRRLSFSGWLHFAAHHGLLDIRIVDPEVIIGAAGGVLVAHTGDDRETVLPIVAVDPVAPSGSGGDLVWTTAASRLLADAVPLFGNVYPEGTDMAPFVARIA